jgi:hypothetical protein
LLDANGCEIDAVSRYRSIGNTVDLYTVPLNLGCHEPNSIRLVRYEQAGKKKNTMAVLDLWLLRFRNATGAVSGWRLIPRVFA